MTTITVSHLQNRHNKKKSIVYYVCHTIVDMISIHFVGNLYNLFTMIEKKAMKGSRKYVKSFPSMHIVLEVLHDIIDNI
jgi:hypothetical protein